jgi:hypothetical protein
MDNPVKILVNNKEDINHILVLPNLGKKYQESKKKPKDKWLKCNL